MLMLDNNAREQGMFQAKGAAGGTGNSWIAACHGD
jgi:hypothetical protein